MKLAQFKKIAPALRLDLEAVFKKHGFDLAPYGGRVDELLGTVKLSLELRDVAHVGADGKKTTPERETYRQLCGIYEMKVEWLDGAEFTMNRESFRITGMKRGRAEKSVLIERVRDSKTFVTTPESVIRAFAAKEAKPTSSMTMADALRS